MQTFLRLVCSLLLTAHISLFAQDTISFESFDVPLDSVLNGSDGSGGFQSEGVFFPNTFTQFPTFFSWTGWAISAQRDSTTPGSGNQFSAITAAGNNSSDTYAVSFAFSPVQLHLDSTTRGSTVQGLYITNSTYVYRDLLEGSQFSKAFGGESGNDPDFLKLTIKKYFNGVLGTDSVDFFLADYRPEDNSMDYIIKDWTWVDLSSLGAVDSLEFSMETTDVGSFGANTPLYFCIDDLVIQRISTSNETPISADLFSVYPNPASQQLFVDWQTFEQAQVELFDLSGKVLLASKLSMGINRLNLSQLNAGMYLLSIQAGQQQHVQRIIKY